MCVSSAPKREGVWFQLSLGTGGVDGAGGTSFPRHRRGSTSNPLRLGDAVIGLDMFSRTF